MLLKHLRLQPSEIWQKPFYEIEYLIDNMKEDNEEQEKLRKEEESKQKKESMSISSMKQDFGNMTKNFNSSMGNMSAPKFPDIKI
ncbi:MAG: hypothetical protein M0R51_05460 [Clostridia bacterium]|nr:hypothetical protein [Clostridia bacterium]